MEGRYGLYRQGSSGWTSMRNEELQEDDVWDVLKDRKDFNSQFGTPKQSSIFAPRGLPSASRMIPRAHNNPTTHEPKIVQQSAPVNIPDWSKIYQNQSKNSSKNNSAWPDYDDDDDDNNGVRRGCLNSDKEDEDDEAEDDDDGRVGNMMPPHEWIAKRHARSQISSFSVCEGVGRTLKGRDLSRVRNAILTRTGFLE